MNGAGGFAQLQRHPAAMLEQAGNSVGDSRLRAPFLLQDRATFRRLIVKNNAKKRRMYETFIESVPLLKSLEVSSF